MRLLFAFAVLSIVACSTGEPVDPNLARAHAALSAVPLVDGHNDLPWRIREDTIARANADKYDLAVKAPGMTDIPRLRSGQLGAQFWSVYIPGDSAAYGFAKMQAEEIAIATRFIEKYPDAFAWTLTAAEIRSAFAAHKIGSMLGVEGGHAIENSLDTLRSYYRQGARYMTLTHNVTLAWADAALDSAIHGGLTKFGEEVVHEMNRLGMLVDISHVSPGTMSDVLNVTEAPVIFSHSSARGLTDHARNVPDSILQRLPKNGGVVMVAFVPDFVSQKKADYAKAQRTAFDSIAKQAARDTVARATADTAWNKAHPSPKATLADVADHIDYIRKVAGVDHVGIGSDFDGITENVVGLEDVSTFPVLFAELARRGWSDAELKKLAGENVLRAMEQAEQVAARLQKEHPASTATIEKVDGRRPAPGKARD
jgi:membrane dipeptidase